MKSLLADRTPPLQRIVERQLRNWELEGRHPSRSRSCERRICPFVTLSRELGSGGEEVAAALGTRLGWKVYDRELLERMAGNEAGRRSLYSTCDERGHTWIHSFSVLWSPETASPRDDYVHALCRTIYDIIGQEPAVFVGRAAHLILPPDKGVRVRIIAPIRERIARIAREQGISTADARRAVMRQDEQWRRFLRDHFNADADSLDPYDVILNMARMTVARACDLIVAALPQTAATSHA